MQRTWLTRRFWRIYLSNQKFVKLQIEQFLVHTWANRGSISFNMDTRWSSYNWKSSLSKDIEHFCKRISGEVRDPPPIILSAEREINNICFVSKSRHSARGFDIGSSPRIKNTNWHAENTIRSRCFPCRNQLSNPKIMPINVGHTARFWHST